MPNSISFQNEFNTRFSVDLNRQDFFLLSAALFEYYSILKLRSDHHSLSSEDSKNLLACSDRCFALSRLFDGFYHEF